MNTNNNIYKYMMNIFCIGAIGKTAFDSQHYRDGARRLNIDLLMK